MIIFYSAILYTTQLIVQHCNCLNLIDLPQGREVFTGKWILASRAPEMYEPYPRKRVFKTYIPRYMLENDRPGDKLHLKASRRVYEDEKDANLKNKIVTLVNQTMSDTEEKMKELDAMKLQHTAEPSYKAGFTLSMVKKSREVINELFNVAVKHRDEWQALEQLKIFEMIVNTNVDTNHYLKQLQDIQAGRDTNLIPRPKKSIDVMPHPKKSIDVAPHPKKSIDVMPHPEKPIEKPIDVAPHPKKSIDVMPHPEKPIEKPIDVAPHPKKSIDETPHDTTINKTEATDHNDSDELPSA